MNEYIKDGLKGSWEWQEEVDRLSAIIEKLKEAGQNMFMVVDPDIYQACKFDAWRKLIKELEEK